MKGESCGRLLYNIFSPLSLALYVRISIAVYGKYRAALRHIDCAFGANIDLHIVPSSTVAATTVPLLHKARQSRAGEGWCVDRRTDSSPTPSSRFQRATFPAIGKVYPTKIFSKSGEGRCIRNFPNGGEWCSLTQLVTATDRRVL